MTYYNEHDSQTAQWLRNLMRDGLIPQGTVDVRSIEDVTADDLTGFRHCHFFAGIGGWAYAAALAHWPDDRPLWTGSCPCQPFSSAGRRQGASDARHLWPAWLRLIRECRPDVVVGEQVASQDGLGWLDTVATDLEALDYAIGAIDLPAAGLGAPILRQRLWFVAESRRHVVKYYRFDVDGSASGSRTTSQEQRLRPDIRASGAVDSVARASRDECGTWRTIETDGRALESTRRGAVGRMGHTDGTGLPPSGTISEGAHGWLAGRASEPASALGGAWSDAEWLACTDDTYRPASPGAFPLVDGLPFLVGSGGPYENKSRATLLKGYGNAIVPQLGAEVLSAYLELRP